MKTNIRFILFAAGALFFIARASGQNIGIGTDSPDQKLEVAGNVKLGDNIMVEGNENFKIYRNLVSYNLEAENSPGAFVIRTNQPWTNSEFSMLIEGYVFNPACKLFNITIGGYTGSYSYIYHGDYKLAVQVGSETASGKLVVILGDIAGTYGYPKVAVVQFKQSWANINESNADGWTVTRETSLAAFSNLVTPANGTDVQWLENGTDIYFNTGEVGIGLNNPTCPLQVRTTNSANNGNAAVVENLGTGTGQYMTALYAQCASTATTNPGAAIYGNHNSLTGNSAGVTGESMSASGRGLYGYASSMTGTNYGIYAKTSSSTNGYAGYFEGPRNYFSGKVGIGTDTPDRELHIYSDDSPSLRVKSLNNPGVELIDVITVGNSLGWKMWMYSYNLNFMYSTNEFSTTPTDGFTMIYDAGGTTDAFAPYTDNTKDLGLLSKRWESVYATDGTIQTSDRDEKQDIRSLQYGLNEVLQLNPVTYRWKARPQDGARIGLIAQEVEPVLPEIIETGMDPESGRELWGMNYSGIIPVLVKAIQEQQVKIETLEKRIEEMERSGKR